MPYWSKRHETICQRLIAEGRHAEAAEMARPIVQGFVARYGRSLCDDDRGDLEAECVARLWRAFSRGMYDPARGRVFSLATKTANNLLWEFTGRRRRHVTGGAPPVEGGEALLVPDGRPDARRLLAGREVLAAVAACHELAPAVIGALAAGGSCNPRWLAGKIHRRVVEVSEALSCMRRTITEAEDE